MTKTDVKLQGFPVSPGCKEGRLFFLPDDEVFFQERSIAQHKENSEIDRFHKALKASRCDLKTLHEQLKNKGHEDVASIIDAHIQMLEDPFITEAVEEGVRSTKKNVEAVFKTVVRSIEKNLFDHKQRIFEERYLDVEDLSGRVLRHLVKYTHFSQEVIPQGSILVVKKLSPSFVAALDPKQVYGIISEVGGVGCHAALIARSKGIPYVTRIPIKEIEKYATYPYVTIEGTLGHICFSYDQRPADTTASEIRETSFSENLTLPVRVWLNLSQLSDLSERIDYPVAGIGLCRSEYLVLENRGLLFSEVMQMGVYLKLAEFMEGKPLVIRAFDVGGDKTPIDFLGIHSPSKERGIRFLMQRPDLLLIQLKAVMSVRKRADIRYLIPFISSPHELDYIQALMDKICQEEPEVYAKVPLGAMIEVPAAVFALEEIAEKADFLSLGTNDLCQFFWGQDRKDIFFESIKSSSYFFKMIQKIVQICSRAHKSLSLCGEMALDPDLIPLFQAMGIEDFSLPIQQLKSFVLMANKKKMTSKQLKGCLEAENPEQFLKRLKGEL